MKFALLMVCVILSGLVGLQAATLHKYKALDGERINIIAQQHEDINTLIEMCEEMEEEIQKILEATGITDSPFQVELAGT